MVDIKIENVTIEQIIGLHESEVFNINKTKELLMQFTKKDLIETIISNDINLELSEDVEESDVEESDIEESDVEEKNETDEIKDIKKNKEITKSVKKEEEKELSLSEDEDDEFMDL